VNSESERNKVHHKSLKPKKSRKSTILLTCTLIYSSQNISLITVLLEELLIFVSLRTFRRCGRLKIISPLIRAAKESINIEADKQLVLKPETGQCVFPCGSYSVPVKSIYLYSCCSHLEHRASVKRFISLQFLNLTESVGPLWRVSTRRKASTYTGQHKHIINADKHSCLEWDSNPRSQCSHGHYDRLSFEYQTQMRTNHCSNYQHHNAEHHREQRINTHRKYRWKHS
jgi:hypothetical protein